MVQALGLTDLATSRLVVPPRAGVDAAHSGTAIDFRARIALGGFDPQDSIAAQGVALLPFHVGAVDNGMHRARVLTEAFDMAVQILNAPSSEDEIDRACLLLAHCEQVYRAGATALAGSLGKALDAVEDGLAFALGIDGPSLADLRALMTANSDQIDQWRELIVKGERFDPNPSFPGSALVGGADADWIVGDTLIDSKAYAKLTVDSLRSFLRQLLGYVMLDFEDALGIRAVGVWLPRQKLTHTWSLERLIGGSPEELLPKLRAGFRSAAGGKQVAARELATQRRKHQILAENRHTPHRMLADLARSGDADIRFRVGRNAATPEETVRELARDRYAKTREGVARNEHAPVDVLTSLSKDASVGVRRAAGANPSLPKEQGKAIGTKPAEPARSDDSEPMGAAQDPADLANKELRISQVREDNGMDTQWFADFLMAARGKPLRAQHLRLPLPHASKVSTLQQGRSLGVPGWLKNCLSESVRYDLMLEHRPAWVRRAVSGDFPVSDPAVRDWLLTDVDPEIRWLTLQRTLDWPDDSLAQMLGKLATDRKARTRFRMEGKGRFAGERYRTPAEYERETLSLVASHPSTPQDALAELLASKSPDVLIALAANSELSVDDLTALIPRLKAIGSDEYRERLAASKGLRPAVAKALVDDRDQVVRAALARNGAVLPEILGRLSEDPEPLVRLEVAANPATPAELVSEVVMPLLISAKDEVLLHILRTTENREDLELPAEILADALERLSKSRVREPDMRLVVACDDRTSSRTLGRLSRSRVDFVRESVANNQSASPETLALLAADSEPSVRASVAANETLDASLLAMLARDDEPEVRASAARSPRLAPSILSKLLRDDDRSVRSSAYRNPSTKSEDKADIDTERERAWRDDAPSRTDLEEMVASKRAEVRMQAAYDPRTPGDILFMLGGERRSVRVRRAVAANPNTPAEALASLADDQDVEILQAVAFNGSTPTEVLVRLAGQSVDLALLVALNPDVSVKLLDALAEDAEPLVGCVAVGARSERAALTMRKYGAESREVLS
ncbi:hypothetical protein [Glutamicibacter sp. BW80]|uniref:hypothetical protein n=1 Tax=Glutamicibacter sp. BW80 TaxID=2024404 RepID=UPI001596EBAF|nr:hypothetical protein [Glutamicibacter sp. BW80]